ncbi:hypothetical protein ACWD6N_03595 [Micromonospora sp. NPDC005163]
MAIDRCTETRPHPAHRTQYGPFGVKDCPGVPMTPAAAEPAYHPGGPVAGPPLTILLFPDECLLAARENRVACVRADHQHQAEG